MSEFRQSTKDGFTIEDGVLKKYTGEEKNIVIPNSVKEIAGGALYGLEAESIIISEGVKKIGKRAVYACHDLKILVLPNSVSYMESEAVFNCQTLEMVNIPTGLERIESRSFEACRSLKSIFIPGNIKSIGDYAFVNCDLLSQVSLAYGVETIGEMVFYNCNVRKIYLPSSIKEVGKNFNNFLAGIFYAIKICDPGSYIQQALEQNFISHVLTYEPVKKKSRFCK